MEKEDFDFEKEYSKLKQKYNLPNLRNLSEDFDLEKLYEKESHFLLRETRRIILDKVSAYLNLFETLINPSGPPMFVFSILRSIEEKDKEKIKEIYKKLSKIQINSMKLDTVYDEKAEVDFINDAFNEWQELKKEIYTIFENFEKNLEKENGSRRKDYYN